MIIAIHVKSLINKMTRFVKSIFFNLLCVPIIEVWHNGFWQYRDYLILKNKGRTGFYDAYLERNSASVGLKSKFESHPILPHGLHGIHISDGAVLGAKIVIMQNVTIGSNTLSDTKKNGAPHIGSNVFIGANASIIGGIIIGCNCRIGANCCVFNDIPNNQTIINGGV